MAYNEEMKNINNVVRFAHGLFAQCDLFQQLNKSFMLACAIERSHFKVDKVSGLLQLSFLSQT